MDEVVVVGTGCPGAFALALAKPVGTEYFVALVAPDGELLSEMPTAELVELAHARLGHVLENLTGVQHDAAAQYVNLQAAVGVFVVALSAYAKVIAEEGGRGFGAFAVLPLRQGPDYLAPDFFRMGMLKRFSARSIIVEFARLRSRSSLSSLLSRLSSSTCALRSLASKA